MHRDKANRDLYEINRIKNKMHEHAKNMLDLPAMSDNELKVEQMITDNLINRHMRLNAGVPRFTAIPTNFLVYTQELKLELINRECVPHERFQNQGEFLVGVLKANNVLPNDILDILDSKRKKKRELSEKLISRRKVNSYRRQQNIRIPSTQEMTKGFKF